MYIGLWLPEIRTPLRPARRPADSAAWWRVVDDDLRRTARDGARDIRVDLRSRSCGPRRLRPVADALLPVDNSPAPPFQMNRKISYLPSSIADVTADPDRRPRRIHRAARGRAVHPRRGDLRRSLAINDWLCDGSSESSGDSPGPARDVVRLLNVQACVRAGMAQRPRWSAPDPRGRRYSCAMGIGLRNPAGRDPQRAGRFARHRRASSLSPAIRGIAASSPRLYWSAASRIARRRRESDDPPGTITASGRHRWRTTASCAS